MTQFQSYTHHSLTHIGLVRKKNEDYVEDRKTDLGHVFVVCDGMGGHSGGETASNLAANTILDYIGLTCSTDNIKECINRGIIDANKVIYQLAHNQIELKGMGTTCAVAVITKYGELYYGHVGDSRVYLFSENELHRLTKDHSLVQFLADKGEISYEEMEIHPDKNKILRAVGAGEKVAPEVCEEPIMLKAGDLVLLCSDGLSGMISDEVIAQTILNSEIQNDTQRITKTLLDKALMQGGKDNISISLIQILATLNKKMPPKTKTHWLRKIFWFLIASALILSFILILKKENKLPFNKPSPNIEQIE